ncbi:MAG: ABC transporter permease subunit [Planctomycetota bacterium]|nr:MAG: ABC transporter permease subunit [Planctomycetota bacterium]
MLLLAGAIGLGAAGLRVRKDAPKRPYAQIGVAACWMVALLLGGAAYLERPGARADLSSDDLAKLEAGIDARIADLRNRQKAALDELAELQAEDRLLRVIATEPTHGRISPISRSEPDEPMMLSQVVRVVEANRLGTRGKLGVYFDRWWEYLSTPPRDGTSAGGVFPVIVGTVTLTILLTISVVPLGVIAALYLREYARQGLLTSCVRIAINNLAGVPSIVYGMFGLGFFCYMLGGYIDAGPAKPMALGSWWALWGAIALLSILSFALGVLGRKTTVVGPSRSGKLAGTLTLVTWTTVVSLAAWAVATTPYFNGFFEERLPEQPTFGGRGILWASLTLALLTLPVVIVATEEAIAAVPGSMREGSYGCGASKWQTMRRIVLPSAMPGIMTGAILAMARGAGEVAPLMLVGAVNLAPALPVSSEPPFLHGERTFMHLGFHIYTLGFQNPDSEATEPLVWTTALLLLTIVLVLNLAAIVLRARLRAKMRTSAV